MFQDLRTNNKCAEKQYYTNLDENLNQVNTKDSRKHGEKTVLHLVEPYCWAEPEPALAAVIFGTTAQKVLKNQSSSMLSGPLKKNYHFF